MRSLCNLRHPTCHRQRQRHDLPRACGTGPNIPRAAAGRTIVGKATQEAYASAPFPYSPPPMPSPADSTAFLAGETPIILAKDVGFAYPVAATGPFKEEVTHFISLQGISFQLPRNALVLVVGHNGSGKSTLLSLLGGKRMPMYLPPNSETTATTAGQTGVCDLRVLGRDSFSDMSLNKEVSLIGAPWPPEAVFANSVDRVTTPCPDEARRRTLAAALHLPLRSMVDKMSSGEKRRVQILYGTLRDSYSVYLLDECSTDIDVAERATVLSLVKEECLRTNGACLYATHILDGVEGWATHVLCMRGGRMVDFRRMDQLGSATLEEYVHSFLAKKNRRHFSDEMSPSPGGTLWQVPGSPKEPVIVCNGLSYKHVFKSLSFEVRRGDRVLLCGCNGSGKSTLLNMIGGKQFFDNRTAALRVFDKVCYDDMSLNALVAYGGDWWTSVPGGQMTVREMIEMDTPRAEALCRLLEVNLDWDVRRISEGEKKRVQLLLHLRVDKPLVILDEATADLDVDQRHELLRFLYAESVCRGVTVVYSTHIFDGLAGWATDVMILDRMKKGLHAFWRAPHATGTGMFHDFERLKQELVMLKSLEVYE